MIDDFLLEVLACPRCESRPPVKLRGSLLVCTECGYGYRIIDEIPQMLPEDAIPPEEVEKENG
ncbi:MAG: Trm112 family protein [Fimbriimonadales bacterium]